MIDDIYLPLPPARETALTALNLMARAQIQLQALVAISKERAHQDIKYGTPAERRLSIGDYLTIAQAELNEAQASAADGDTENALRELLQVAAVAVACMEQHGIVER